MGDIRLFTKKEKKGKLETLTKKIKINIQNIRMKFGIAMQHESKNIETTEGIELQIRKEKERLKWRISLKNWEQR